MMRVLIVEENMSRGQLWSRFLKKQGAETVLVTTQDHAFSVMTEHSFDALVINLAISNASVLAISDLATYRNPNIAIIAVTSGNFFSDGSLFKLIPNARGCVGDNVSPADLSEIVCHYGDKSTFSDGVRSNQVLD